MTKHHSTLNFPKEFRWGTATSAHQVEGNLTNNDWAAAERAGGYVYQNQTAGRACDWWNRAEEDFDRMVEMNHNAHRLSVEWSRIQPRPDVWDEYALDRYRDMLVSLRARGIEPMVTLHHFTNPIWLAEQGGWENEAVVGWFERFTRKVVSRLGDLTRLWCTINEPAVMIAQAYGLSRFPPGKSDFNAALRVAINVMRAHAAAYRTVHELVPGAQVGLAKHMMIWQPWRPWQPLDHLLTTIIEQLFNHLPLTMLTEGIMRVPGRRALRIPGLTNTLDWLGVNYYQRFRIQFNLSSRSTFFARQHNKPGILAGPEGWGEIHPRGLYDTLRVLWRRYRLPMFITENGIPDETDEHRPGFIVSHLHELWGAIQRGIPIQGYYFWSLVDNFEWTEGYDPRFRFGLIGVDFETQERHIRQSGRLYGAICRYGGLRREVVEQYTPTLVPQVFPTT
jgi:beta-glucosidase